MRSDECKINYLKFTLDENTIKVSDKASSLLLIKSSQLCLKISWQWWNNIVLIVIVENLKDQDHSAGITLGDSSSHVLNNTDSTEELQVSVVLIKMDWVGDLAKW